VHEFGLYDSLKSRFALETEGLQRAPKFRDGVNLMTPEILGVFVVGSDYVEVSYGTLTYGEPLFGITYMRDRDKSRAAFDLDDVLEELGIARTQFRQTD
jgi:hypothetical protein